MSLHLIKKKFTRYSFCISYDGSKFHGWAIQPNVKTVQGDLQKALSALYNLKIIVYGSGRTDAGVHAINQVFHFDAPSNINVSNISKYLNNFNKGKWYIFNGKKYLNNFHSRFNVKRKIYLYKIICTKKIDPLLYDYSWQIPFDLNISKLRKISKIFIGLHDFLSFTTEKKDNTIRQIYNIKINKIKNFISIKIIGSGFLQSMVRMLIATIVNFACDKITIDYCQMLLDKPKKGQVIYKAPASGLYLLKVIY